jgi:hypothetical protein
MADYTDVPPKEAMHKVFLAAAKLPVIPSSEQEQFWPGSALSVWQAHTDMVLALLKTKQAYGNAWQEQGYMGNLARIQSKTSRLKNMLWRDDGPDMSVAMDGSDKDPAAETVLDTLLDLSALCAMAIANIEDGNRWGK